MKLLLAGHVCNVQVKRLNREKSYLVSGFAADVEAFLTAKEPDRPAVDQGPARARTRVRHWGDKARQSRL